MFCSICSAYDDVKTSIRVGEDGAVFFSVDDKDNSVHITMSAAQAHTIGEMLHAVALSIDTQLISKSSSWGGSTIDIEREDLPVFSGIKSINNISAIISEIKESDAIEEQSA